MTAADDGRATSHLRLPHARFCWLRNILFLIVESTDGRTWTPGYSNDALKLPNLRALQKGGLNFQHHFSNSPVCCPSRCGDAQPKNHGKKTHCILLKGC